MPHRRRNRVTRVVAALITVAAATTLAAATAAARPGPADPPKAGGTHVDPRLGQRIGAVNAELDRLARRNAQLDEQYNVAAEAVTAARQAARQAQQAAHRASARFRAAHVRFVQAVTQQYESGPDPSIGRLLTSSAPQQYIDGLILADYLSNQFAVTVQAEQAARADTADMARRATAALAAARTKESALAERQAALQQQAQRFQRVLGTLTAQQQRERARALAVAAAKARAELAAQPQPARHHRARATARSAPRRIAGSVPAAVQRVIAFAEAQVGKAYGYGDAGPDAYDCSGLTMAAWAKAGVQLPHSAAEQYNYGTHVTYRHLQPGDLIFLYSPIGHVELYVGHDLAVSAADPSIGIVYVRPSRDLADYAGATRLTP